jgi:hypothetical protein
MENIVKGIGGEYTGNYTGPYWSNGLVQNSVEWGDKTPTSALDYLSRQHDSAYAKFKDDAHREAADIIYNEEAKKLEGKFPSLAGNLVLYTNLIERRATKTAKNVANGAKFFGLPGALGGLIYTAAGNIVDASKMIDGKYLKDELKHVRDYYEIDPRKKNFEYIRNPKGFNDGKKGLSDSKVALPRGGPSVKDVEHVKLITKQAKHFEHYADLKEKANEKQLKLENTPIPAWNFLGYQGRRKRHKRKTNKIHITTSS